LLYQKLVHYGDLSQSGKDDVPEWMGLHPDLKHWDQTSICDSSLRKEPAIPRQQRPFFAGMQAQQQQ
jgi:hypothetical protein